MRNKETYYHKIGAPLGVTDLPTGVLDSDAVNVSQLNEAIADIPEVDLSGYVQLSPSIAQTGSINLNGGVRASSFTLSALPTEDLTGAQIVTRNPTTGVFEYLNGTGFASNFIQNQNFYDQPANFRINGEGVIGGALNVADEVRANQFYTTGSRNFIGSGYFQSGSNDDGLDFGVYYGNKMALRNAGSTFATTLNVSNNVGSNKDITFPDATGTVALFDNAGKFIIPTPPTTDATPTQILTLDATTGEVKKATDNSYITIKGTQYRTGDTLNAWYTTGGFGGSRNAYDLYFNSEIFTSVDTTGNFYLVKTPIKNTDNAYKIIVRGDTSGSLQEAPDTLTHTALRLGDTFSTLDEEISLRISTPVRTDDIGRGLKIENRFNGIYGATGLEVQEYAEGNNDSDHQNAIQSFVYKNGTGHRSWLANVYSTKVLNNTNVDNYYGYYYNSGTGSATNNYSFYAVGSDPMFTSSKLGISNNILLEADYKHPLHISKTFGEGAFGITNAQAGIYADNTAANATGGVLALGGMSGFSSSPYPFAFLKGSPENVGTTYAGRLSFYTGSGGNNPGETNSANYERATITSRGNLLINTTTDDGVNKLQVNGSATVQTNGGTAKSVVRNEDLPSGFETAYLATSQTLTANTPTVITMTGAAQTSNGGIDLLDLTNNIVTGAVNDVILLDVALPFTTPSGTNNFMTMIIRVKTTGAVYRTITHSILKGSGNQDYLTASFSIPYNSDAATNGLEIIVDSTVGVTFNTKFISATRVHKNR